ncbi:MAG TPA: carbamoyltransferase N-terminal domain-containing protein, partial [Polyangiaceae bacterium]|nr:carbamoyltransferase N-terminal domain-containing protein [Polyangiaceae bacterium]
MNVLGISAFYHDSAACLVRDGQLVAAAQEERFSRVRFDAAMPWQAIQSCLSQGRIDARDVDLVAFYEKPLLRFDRAMTTFVQAWPAGRRAFSDTAASWLGQRLRLRSLLRDELGWRGRLVFVAHHEAHAA